MLFAHIARLRREPPEVRRAAVVRWTVAIVLFVIALYAAYLFWGSQTVIDPEPQPRLIPPYQAAAGD